MKLGSPGATPPAQSPAHGSSFALAGDAPCANEEPLDVARQREDPYAVLAVRALAVLIGFVGSLLLLLELVQRGYGPFNVLGQSRALMGGCLFAGGAGAWLLSRRGWRRASATVSLTLAVLALMLHAWHSGLGTHSIALGGTVLLAAVAGILVNMPTAIALGLVDAVLIVGLEVAERRGILSPAAADLDLAVESRSLSFAMLTVVGLITAWIVRRQLVGTVQRAQEQERRMSRLLRLGSDFTWEMDPQGYLTWLSPSFEKHTQHAVAEFMQLARPGGPTMAKDAQWELLMADMKARRPYRDRVIQFITARGEVLFISGSGEPLFDATGRHLGWWGVSRNATAEVLA